ncbi:MAG TPA: hypothetical protein VE010_19795 [Thermoanaerobaculia bacterium]|nr:hypothetical protein [Thermoanaerobaculia bacterium]
MERVPAIVAGIGLNALGVMRSLGRARIPLYNLNPQHDYVTSSRWYRPVPRAWGALEDGQPLDAYLARLPLERAVLFAASDDRVLEAAALDSGLQARFPAALASPATLHALLDKLSLARLLVARDLPHPKTYVARGSEDLERVPDQIFANAFLKPRDSLAFNRQYRVKGFRVTSRDDARTRLAQIHGDSFEAVLQEYIPGDADRHYFIDGFVDRHGAIARFARRRVRMYPADFGNSSSMISVPLAEVEGAIATLDRLLLDTKYRGIFSAEFKLDPRDNLFKLLEVNCRPWWFNGFAADCGVDTTLMAYDDALGRPVAPVNGYKVGAKLVYSFNDVRASWRMYRQSTLTIGAALKFWAGASDALFCSDDPRPFFRYVAQQLRRTGRGAFRRRHGTHP